MEQNEIEVELLISKSGKELEETEGSRNKLKRMGKKVGRSNLCFFF